MPQKEVSIKTMYELPSVKYFIFSIMNIPQRFLPGELLNRFKNYQGLSCVEKNAYEGPHLINSNAS